MQVMCKVVDVSERQTQKGLVADIVMLLQEPTEAITVTMFAGDVAEGKHIPWRQAVGKEVTTALRARVWNNQVSYNLNFGAAPRVLGAQVKAAS